MEPDTRQRIVLVRAYFEGGDPKVGTGFRIAPNLVLTSQHVVQQIDAAGETKTASRVEVAVDLDGCGNDVKRGAATVLWAGEQKLSPDEASALDAALLEDQLPLQDMQPFRNLIWRPLASCEWDTAGYAVASPNYSNLRPDELRGEVGAIKPGETYLELIVGRERPKDLRNAFGEAVDQSGWAGVSGAPVFVTSGPYRGYLYGVIRRCPPRMNDTLYAVALPALLQNASFCRYLRVEDEAGQRRQLAEDLVSMLGGNRPLAVCIANAHKTWSDGLNNCDIEGLVEAIDAQGELPEILEELQRIKEEWQKTCDTDWAMGFQKASRLIAALIGARALPCCFDEHITNRLALGVSSPSLAEIGVSGREGRAADFVPVPGDIPRARLRAPLSTVESGILKEQATKDQLKLVEDFLYNELNRSPWLFPESVKALSVRPPEKRREEWIDAVRRRMCRLLRKHKGSPYIVADNVFRQHYGEQAQAFLQELAVLIPELFQVVLTGDPARRPQEDDLLEPLWEILNLISEENDQ